MTNAMEEGVLLQVDNPSHTAIGRTAVSGGMVAGISSFVGMLYWAPSFELIGAMAFSIVLFLVVSVLLYRRIHKSRVAAEAQRLIEEREARRREDDAQISELKREGRL